MSDDKDVNWLDLTSFSVVIPVEGFYRRMVRAIDASDAVKKAELAMRLDGAVSLLQTGESRVNEVKENEP